MKASTGPTSTPSRSTKKDRLPVRWFLLFWIVIIALFVYAAYAYSQKLQEQTLSTLQTQTETQMASLRADYEKQFAQLNQQVTAL